MNTLAIIAVVNMALWGGAFAVLWWTGRAQAKLEAEIDALEDRLKE
ncbi:MAG: hypothetical protein JXB47_16265 [Anaerolineae bacterium]|nr:hypothetical protein [Anaerolineae bacterium]